MTLSYILPQRITPLLRIDCICHYLPIEPYNATITEDACPFLFMETCQSVFVISVKDNVSFSREFTPWLLSDFSFSDEFYLIGLLHINFFCISDLEDDKYFIPESLLNAFDW